MWKEGRGKKGTGGSAGAQGEAEPQRRFLFEACDSPPSPASIQPSWLPPIVLVSRDPPSSQTRCDCRVSSVRPSGACRDTFRKGVLGSSGVHLDKAQHSPLHPGNPRWLLLGLPGAELGSPPPAEPVRHRHEELPWLPAPPEHFPVTGWNTYGCLRTSKAARHSGDTCNPRRLRREDHKYEASLCNLAKACLMMKIQKVGDVARW